jgi:hypothetical protein
MAKTSPIGFDQRAREGVELFNAREYWESHEAWEDVWREGNEAERLFYQGLIQVAAGLVKIQKAWWAPAIKNLIKGLAKLEKVEGSEAPIELEALVAEVRSVLRKLREEGEAALRQGRWNWWPRIRLRE